MQDNADLQRVGALAQPDGLRDCIVNVRLHRGHQTQLIFRADIDRLHKMRRPGRLRAMQFLEVMARRAFELEAHRLAISPAHAAHGLEGKNGLDTARYIVSQQADRAGGRHRQQMTVANAVLRNRVLKLARQLQHERTGAVFDLVKLGEGALLLRDLDRRAVGGVAQRAHDLVRQVTARL